MTRRGILRRSRDEIQAYTRAYARVHGVSAALATSTYLQNELLYALLGSGIAPWLCLTGGIALQRAHHSTRWHPDIDLISDRPPGARELQRWHESIDFCISKTYGLKWNRRAPADADPQPSYLNGALSWLDDPGLCSPIRVRILKTSSAIGVPHRISILHEATPLPMADLALHVEPLDRLLARTLMSMRDDPLSISRGVYDLSVLNALSARMRWAAIAQAIADRGDSIAITLDRIGRCIRHIESHQLHGGWLAWLADEIRAKSIEATTPIGGELLSSALVVLRKVQQRLMRSR